MFDKNLKYLRSKFGMEQIELAHKLGKKSSSSISEWEKGKYTPKIKTLAEIANIFNVDLDDMMNRDLAIIELTTENKISNVVQKLKEERQAKVLKFSEYQLEEQVNELKESNVHYLLDYGAVSAGTGEFLQEENPVEVEYIGEVPQHDFTVTVNGASMEPVLQHGERLFITATSAARVGQIVIASVNGEAFVKKLGQDRLISLNKDYKDIEIDEHGEAKIIGIVVL